MLQMLRFTLYSRVAGYNCVCVCVCVGGDTRVCNVETVRGLQVDCVLFDSTPVNVIDRLWSVYAVLCGYYY
jgi:hypothetical protein